MNGKEKVGQAAAQLVEDGMTVGLGTGSTAYYFIEELGRRVQEEGLKLGGAVPTSLASQKQAEALGIQTSSIDEVDRLDLTIDGVDEFTGPEAGIKGGGGALLVEKIIGQNSKRIIWIAETRKHVKHLGAFPLPVEVITEGHEQLLRYFAQKGYAPNLRRADDDQPFVTQHGHYIIDLALEKIEDPEALAKELIQIVGVVETGLFLNRTEKVLASDEHGDIVTYE